MDEPKLISNSGPVFEVGPGWGSRVMGWLGKYFWKVILPLIIVILVIYGIVTRQETPGIIIEETLSPKTSLPLGGVISQTVGKGEGKILVARRAIAEYLSLHPEITVSAGQKIYLETVIAQTISSGDFYAGDTVTFSNDSINSEIEKSKLLTSEQLRKWEGYAR